MPHAPSFAHLLRNPSKNDPAATTDDQPMPAEAPARARRRAAEPIACPHCGHAAGFILDVDDFAYRVLEDDQDTDLLGDLDDATPLTCAHCDTGITLVQALSLAHERAPGTPPRSRPGRAGHPRRSSHPHDAGTARLRTTADGRVLPACPQCPRDHGYLADVDGVAYHVIEDDDDTDLLTEASNLLCPDCGAVFTVAPA